MSAFRYYSSCLQAVNACYCIYCSYTIYTVNPSLIIHITWIKTVIHDELTWRLWGIDRTILKVCFQILFLVFTGNQGLLLYILQSYYSDCKTYLNYKLNLDKNHDLHSAYFSGYTQASLFLGFTLHYPDKVAR